MICPECGSLIISENNENADEKYLCLDCYSEFSDYLHIPSKEEEEESIIVHTDGACSCNPGPAGVGVLLRYKKHEKRISQYLGKATNNIAELTAIKVALESIKTTDIPIQIHTDSKYSIGVLTNPSWNPKKNKEMIHSIKTIMSNFKKIDLFWVKGHSNSEENNIVDQLAVKAYLDKKDFEIRDIRE